MRTSLAFVLLLLTGCATTQSDYVSSYQAADTGRALCRPGSTPIFVTRGMSRTFNGCMDYRDMRLLYIK